MQFQKINVSELSGWLFLRNNSTKSYLGGGWLSSYGSSINDHGIEFVEELFGPVVVRHISHILQMGNQSGHVVRVVTEFVHVGKVGEYQRYAERSWNGGINVLIMKKLQLFNVLPHWCAIILNMYTIDK